MMTRMVDLNMFRKKARQIKNRVPVILLQWGLPVKFTRWRLTHDPDSGMVVLFGVLNTRYIATHSDIPFSDYFDNNLLNNLASDLSTQVVSCHSDGLRYAFILDRGKIDLLPTHIDYPFREGKRLIARVVYGNKPKIEGVKPQISPDVKNNTDAVNDQILIKQGVDGFLKVFEDLKVSSDDALSHSVQDAPDVVVIETENFKKRVAEYNAAQKRSDKEETIH